jgi:hypothetical protein
MFARCSFCRREVMVIPHKSGWRYRIHTGVLTRWCVGTHKPADVEAKAS